MIIVTSSPRIRRPIPLHPFLPLSGIPAFQLKVPLMSDRPDPLPLEDNVGNRPNDGNKVEREVEQRAEEGVRGGEPGERTFEQRTQTGIASPSAAG